jgi:lysophospholipase L1-like esterase
MVTYGAEDTLCYQPLIMMNLSRKRIPNALGIIILLLVVTAISAIALESVARIVVGVPMKEKLPLSRVKADPDIGWVMVPSDEHYTYEYLIKLNELGFRDSEISEKQTQEYRILAVGDSHIYGQGLHDNELMTTLLEQELRKNSSSCQFNVINMGVRAYSTNNEKAMLEKVGFGLDPDLIILFFYINDFIPVNIANRYNKFAEMDWYTFDFSDKPTDRLVDKWKLIQILRNSAFLMWVYDTYRGWTNRSSYIDKMMLGELDSRIRKNIKNTIETLEEIRLLTEEHGARLIIAVIPVAAQITNAFPDQIYQSKLKQYAMNAGLDFVDLLPDLRSHHSQFQDSLVIPFDGHYNSNGHRVMAMSIFDHLNSLTVCQ